MVTIQQIQTALDQLFERKIIELYEGRYYKFTEFGWKYTEGRSSDSWCDITWTYDGITRYWMPIHVFNEALNKYEWTFCKIDEIKDEEFDRFCKFFELDLGNCVIAIDVDEQCL